MTHTLRIRFRSVFPTHVGVNRLARLTPDGCPSIPHTRGGEPWRTSECFWQLWELDLPLADWREEVVTWVYLDLPTSRPDQGVVLPARDPALCAAHKRWLPSPMLLNIPLLCENLTWEDFLLSPGGLYEPLTHLEQLGVPLRPDGYIEEADALRLVSHPGQTVALATLIEYAVTTYGQERLPALVAGLGQYESWATLLPAVYGVSMAEFEVGWQNYLVVHYRFGK